MKAILLVLTCLRPLLSFAQIANEPGTVLWGVTNQRGDTSYLFAVFHEFGNTSVDQYPEARVFRKVDYIVLEATVETVDKMHVTNNWLDKLSKSDHQAINNYVKKLRPGFKLKQAKYIPPSWLRYDILGELYKKQCGTWTAQDVIGVEQYLANSSVTNRKRLIGLESANDTFGVINSMMGASSNEDSEGVTQLLKLVKNEKLYLDSLQELCSEAHNYQNLKIDYRFSNYSVEDDSSYVALLDARNNAWMPKITSVIDSGRAFIAVGMKHLFYKKGIIMQLRANGYNVFPIAVHKTEVTYRKKQ